MSKRISLRYIVFKLGNLLEVSKEEDQNGISIESSSYRHQVIEVCIAWRPHFKCALAYIVESLVVKAECHVTILHKLIGGQNGIVWFHYNFWYLREIEYIYIGR